MGDAGHYVYEGAGDVEDFFDLEGLVVSWVLDEGGGRGH